MRFPLPLRITIPATVFFFGVLLGGLSFVYEVTSSYRRIEADIQSRAEFLGRQNSELLRYHIENNDMAAANRQIASLGNSPNLRMALVCDEADRILSATDAAWRNRLLHETSAAPAKEAMDTIRRRIVPGMGLPERMPAAVVFSSDRNSLSATFLFPMAQAGAEAGHAGVGTLYLEYDIASMKELELADVRRRSLIIGSLLAFLCLVVWVFFDRTLTRRVLKLSAATQRLAKGNFDSRAGLRGSDELAQLSEAFDQMAGDIRARTAELEEANKKMKREISEREQAENRFLSVWKSSVDGMRLTDQSGEIIAVNEAYCQLVGMSPDELEGKPFVVCYRAEDGVEMLETYRQRFANRSFQTFIERQLQFRTGKTADLEVASSFIAQDNDEPLLLSIFRDVTERKRTEELLHQQAASMEASLDGMAIHDQNGRFIYLNEAYASIYGYERTEDLIGKSWEMLYDEGELSRFRQEIMPEFWRIGRWRGESTGKRPDGTTIPQEISLSRIETGGMVCVVRDITARKLEEERRQALDRKLLDAQKLESLGVLAGGIAHDFNNLLTAILGNASLALMQSYEESRVRTYLANIEKTSMQAADLCKQMLAYSGKGRFVIQRIDVNALIMDMQQLLQISINKRVTLHFDLKEGVPAIEADPSQMRQVMMNLVINASEAIGDKNGVINVRSGVMEADRDYLSETYLSPDLPVGNYVFVEVSDSGCGMSPETKAKIFEPFFSTKFTGRGLGLAAVLGIIRGHEGALKVYSEPGKGTSFKFLIPSADAPAQALHPDQGRPSNWRGKGTVLVVDDEPTVRTVTSQMLKNIGFDVLTAEDGRQGVETFAQNCGQITAVVLDMTMPRMNGEEAFREMRRLRGDVPIILVSGYSEQDATTQFAGKGLSGFVQKPFKIEDLRTKLRQALERLA